MFSCTLLKDFLFTTIAVFLDTDWKKLIHRNSCFCFLWVFWISTNSCYSIPGFLLEFYFMYCKSFLSDQFYMYEVLLNFQINTLIIFCQSKMKVGGCRWLLIVMHNSSNIMLIQREKLIKKMWMIKALAQQPQQWSR